MHRGGTRNKSEFSSSGGGGGRRGRGGRHPSGLSGKQIGLWYAARSRGKQKKGGRELKQRAYVTMDSHREERISQLLGEFRENEHSSSNDRVQAGASGASGASGDWYDAPCEDRFNEQSEAGQPYMYNRDQPEAGPCNRDADMQVAFGDQFAAKAAEDVYIPDEEDNRINQSTSKYFSHKHLNKDTDLDQKLIEEMQTKDKSGSVRYRAMQEFRKKLPAYEQKEELLQLVNSEQVLVISGETGCGKTTQVTQFILDDAITRGCGSTCRVMCTQPRRISAISVAERVAAERDEKCGENGSVGFQIRLESKLPRKQGSILYCTTGVLLRWLVSDPLLLGTSHVILDEIHERDLFSDFLIIILRDVLPKRPDLKLILMSATLNSEMFAAYFGNCKMSHIPGFTFPVQELYLEEIIEKTGYEVKEKAVSFGRKEPGWKQHGRTKSSAKDKRLEKCNAWLAESQWDDEEMEWQQYLHSIRGRFSTKTITTLQNMDLEKIDFQLLVRVITHISLRMEEGAILVFLPGWDDISKLHDNLKEQTLFSLTDKFCIIPLHSMMPSARQQEVFDRPPKGVRKIVIATNIAETSITIDDVVFVVDAGKAKQKTYDANNKISCLKSKWISKASSQQRRGRAGRVQPGYCFHLFTQPRAQSLDDYLLPEMLRTPLEELCLQIKILKLGMIGPFLDKALQRPEEQAVSNALEVLHQLNALDANEELTPLGYHLASLPINPRVGKIILFGAMFSCLDPVLTVASILGFRDPFVIPLGKQIEADQARKRFAGDTRSDHLAVLKAFQGWESSARHGDDTRDYCWRNFLSMNTMKMIKDMKQQFAGLLYEIGFLKTSHPKDVAANYNSDNLKLVKAILCAGLYPNVANINHHPSLKRPPKIHTQQDGRVFLHPKSVNAEVNIFQDNWLIYHEKMRSSSLFLYDSTMIAPFPLLFFGGEISVFVEEGYETVAVDDFIKFKSPTRIANLVKELRVELDKLLRQKIAQPEMTLSVGTGTGSKESALLRAIIDLITSEENTNWKKQRALASESKGRGTQERPK